MEPTSYGNRAAPLRLSPPRARPTNYINNVSPLRKSPQTVSPSSNIFQNEDDRYEQRRQDELRRQIRVKEKELEQISSSKERFKQRIERTLGLTGSYPDIPRPNDTTISKKHASPLRHLDGVTYSQPSSYIAESRERYSQPQRTNGRTEGSPLRATQKREPQKTISQFQTTTHMTKPHAPRINSDYANQLFNDNQQLQRRLNLVVAELDRINREKQAAQHRLAQTASETDHLMHQIQNEERDDKHLHDMSHELMHSKQENQRVQNDIKFTDQLRNESLNRLRMLQAERERRVANCEDISEGLVKKLSVMKDLEREINMNKVKIDDIMRQLPALERQNHAENHSIHEIHLIIERLVRERDELMSKLQHLNLTYDQTVAEISRERAQLESHNKRHTQLLTSKVIFQALESMVLARKQASLNEFFNYCKFDEKCHKTLKTFAGVLQRCGLYQMRIALKKWFRTALEPVSVITQGKDLLKIYRQRCDDIRGINQRTGKAATAAERQQHKQEAAKAIFAVKSHDVWKDCCRYFTIWRDKMRLTAKREERLRLLITRQTSNRKRQAVNKWRNYSLYVNDLVRCHVLRKSFAQDQMLLITFNQLKFATSRHKRIRLTRLKHLFKGWQDSNAYGKYMMGQIVMAGNLNKTLKNKIMASCFDALKLNKEAEKYQLVNDKLQNDTHVAIDTETVKIGDESAKSLRNEKLRKLRALARQVETRVASYFYHWKQVTDAYKVFVMKNCHEILLRKYQETTHQAFNRWMNGVNAKNQAEQQGVIDDYVATNDDSLGKDIASLALDIKAEVERQKTRARVKLTRACDIFAQRMLRRGLRQWRARCQMMTDKERAANYLSNKLKISRLKAAWRLYLSQILQKRQDDKDDARALFYRQTREARIMRKHFNALCVFIHNFKKSKTYWSIVLNKMDVWMKRRTFLRWIDNSHLTRVQQLTGIQGDESNDFDDKNSALRKGQATLQEKDQENKLLNGELRKNAQRGMSNYFARLYYTRLQARFKKWKQTVVDMKHRELLIRKFAEQWRNHRFYYMKAAFKNWIHRAKCHETKIEIRQTKIAGDEQQHANTFKQQQHLDNTTQLEQEIAIQDAEASLHGARAQYILSSIIRKNDMNHYQSNKRYIFGVWVAHIQRQKRFVVAINNVLRKSCLQQGLDNINAFSRDKALCRGQNHALSYFRRMWFKFQIGGAFAKWRTFQLDGINDNRKVTDADRIRRTSKHATWVQKVKDVNCMRVYNVLRRFRLHSLMRGWENVTRWQRAQKVCTKQKADQWLAYNTRRALKKWFERKQLTIKVRGHFNQFEAWKARYYKQACFNQLKTTKNNSKAFCNRLGELAKKFDYRNLLSAYYTIKNFRTSKENTYSRQKKQAANELINVLHELYLRKMAANMSDLRVKVIRQKGRSLHLLGLLNQLWIQRLRRNFQKWKRSKERKDAVIEVNQEGPVVEIVLDEQARYYNLKGFMEHQGYRKFEIDDVVKITEEKAQEGLARSVARWKAYKGPNNAYLKPKMFDRWVAYVKFRRLMRYLGRNMMNKLQPVKADLSIAFNRWKYMTGKSHAAMNGLDKEVLVAKCAENQRTIDKLEDRSNETEEYLGHMGMQRNELVENYMKSQRLAIALGRDNLERGMAKGVSALSDNMNAQKRSHFEEILQRNINLIANLKDKIKDFEVDNESLANENEELRQFSLDGYQIAKNVQSLSNERERLSVDLADKATTIKKLLDENEGLSIRLREAQQNAARLIQQSSNNLRQMQRQSSGAGYF